MKLEIKDWEAFLAGIWGVIASVLIIMLIVGMLLKIDELVVLAYIGFFVTGFITVLTIAIKGLKEGLKVVKKPIKFIVSQKGEPMDLEEILKCPICGKRFVKESEHIWKPACGCFRKEIRISVG